MSQVCVAGRGNVVGRWGGSGRERYLGWLACAPRDTVRSSYE